MANVTGASLAPIYGRLNSVPSYYPIEADTFADWSLEAGDMITVSRDGKNYGSQVHSMDVTWKGRTPTVSVNAGGNEHRPSIAKVSRDKYVRSGAGMRNGQGIYQEFFSSDGYLHSVLEMNESRLRTTFEDGLNGLRGEVQQTASYWRSTYEDLSNSLRGEIEQTASYWRSTYEDGLNGLRGEIRQTASYWRSTYEDLANSLRGEVEQTAAYWRSTYEDAANGLKGIVEQTASYWRASFEDAANNMRGEVEQTAAYWRASYADAANGLMGVVEQTSNYWRSTYEDMANDLRGEIQQTAAYWRSTYEDAANGLRGVVEQTASYWRSTYEDSFNGLFSDIEQTASHWRSEYETASGLRSEIEQTASHVRSVLSDAQGYAGEIEQTASSVRSTYTDAQGYASEIQQTASAVRTALTNAQGDAATISQTASAVRTALTNAQGDAATISQTASAVRTALTNAQGDAATISQTASAVRTALTNVQGDAATISQTASQVRTALSDAQGYVGEIEQTASSMRSVYTDANNAKGEIIQTASYWSSSYETAEGLLGVVEQTASYWRTEYQNAESWKSSIEQTASGWKTALSGVMSNGRVTAASIATAINAQGAAGVQISGDWVTIGGNTKLSTKLTINNGNLQIEGNSQFTGDISVLGGGSVSATDLVVYAGGSIKFLGASYGQQWNLRSTDLVGLLKAVQIVQDGNDYKLQYKSYTADDWIDAGTFRRASLVSGSWSGSTYTVSADSNGTSLPISTSVIMQVEGANNPNATVYVKLYKNSPTRTNEIDSGTLNLVELSGQKKVELRLTVGNTYLTKGSISTAETYNAGWDYGLTQYIVTTPEPTSQEMNTKTLGFGERYKVLYTFKRSNGTTFESKQIIKAPDQPDPVYVVPVINGPSWSLYGNNAGDTNTVSASATGATTKYSYTKLIMGTAFNASTHIGQVQLKASTVSSSDAGTNGTIVGRLNVDASSVWTQGNNAVTLSDTVTFTEALSSDPKYSYNTAKVSTTGRSSGNLEKIIPLYLKEGGWSGKKEYVYLYYASPSDNTKRMAKIEVDGSGIYKNGWDAARAKVSLPSANTSSNSISIGIPPETVDGAAVTKQYAIAQTANDPDRVDLVSSENGTNTIVARWRHGQYTIGRGVGQGEVGFQSIGIKSGSVLPANDEADTSSYDDVKTKIIEAVLTNGKSDTLNLKYRWAKYSPQSGVQHNCVNIAVGKGGTTDTRVGRIDIEQLYEDGKTAGKSLANVTVAWEQSNPQSSANPYNKLVVYREGTALASLNQVISTDITYDSSTHKYTATTTSSGKSGSVITATSNDQAYKDGYNAVSISIGMSSSDDALIGNGNTAENTGNNAYDKQITRHVVAAGNPGTATATMRLEYRATTYKTANNETHECVNISVGQGTVNTRVGRIDVHPVYESGHDSGYTDAHLTAGTWGGTNGNVLTVQKTTSGSANARSFTVTAGVSSQSYNSSTHKYTAFGYAYVDGTQRASSGSSVSGTEAYTDGRNSVSVSSITCTEGEYPSTSAETSTKTIHIYATVSSGNAAGALSTILVYGRNSYTDSKGKSHRCVNIRLGSDNTLIGRMNVDQDYNDGYDAAKLTAGTWGGTNGNVLTVSKSTSGANNRSFTITAGVSSQSYNSSTHKYTAFGYAYVGGIQRASSGSSVSGTEAYTDGRNSVSVSSITCTEGEYSSTSAETSTKTIHIYATVSSGNAAGALSTILVYGRNTYKDGNNNTHRCVNIRLGSNNMLIGRMNVDQDYNDGYDAAKLTAGTWGGTNGNVLTVEKSTSGRNARSFTVTAGVSSQSYNSDTHKYTAFGYAYVDGFQRASSGSSVSGTEAYTDGRNSVSVSSITCSEGAIGTNDASTSSTTKHIYATVSTGNASKAMSTILVFGRNSYTDSNGKSHRCVNIRLGSDNTLIGRMDVDADRVSGWNAYYSNSSLWKVPTDSGANGKFWIPNKLTDWYTYLDNTSMVEWGAATDAYNNYGSSQNTAGQSTGWIDCYNTMRLAEGSGNTATTMGTTKTLYPGDSVAVSVRALASKGATGETSKQSCTITAKVRNTDITPTTATAMGSIGKSDSGASSFISNCTRLKATSSSNVCSTGKYYKFTVKCGTAQRTYYFET